MKSDKQISKKIKDLVLNRSKFTDSDYVFDGEDEHMVSYYDPHTTEETLRELVKFILGRELEN